MQAPRYARGFLREEEILFGLRARLSAAELRADSTASTCPP